MVHDPGNEADSIVRSAKGLVIAILEQQRERLRMTVSAQEISEAVAGQAEGVHLAI